MCSENLDGESVLEVLVRTMNKADFFGLVKKAYKGDIHALSFRFLLLKDFPG